MMMYVFIFRQLFGAEKAMRTKLLGGLASGRNPKGNTRLRGRVSPNSEVGRANAEERPLKWGGGSNHDRGA